MSFLRNWVRLWVCHGYWEYNNRSSLRDSPTNTYRGGHSSSLVSRVIHVKPVKDDGGCWSELIISGIYLKQGPIKFSLFRLQTYHSLFWLRPVASTVKMSMLSTRACSGGMSVSGPVLHNDTCFTSSRMSADMNWSDTRVIQSLPSLSAPSPPPSSIRQRIASLRRHAL